MRTRSALAATALLAAVALLAACSGDDGDTTTTSGGDAAGPVTSLPGDSETGTGVTQPDGSAATSTTIDLGEPTIPVWEIYSQDDSGEGAELVVVLDPESYQSLTDIDLQNVIAEVVDEEGDAVVVHVVDDEQVAEFVQAEDPSNQQQRQLDLHYLARLEDGSRIVFLGPFSDTAAVVLGS